MIVDFFDVPFSIGNGRNSEAPDLPQFTQFAKTIGVSRSTLFKWTQEYPEFSDAYSLAKELQEELLVNSALKNRYNPYFTQFLLKNSHGYRDRQEVEQTVQQIQISKEDEQL